MAALKHRWSLANNYLSGITAGVWWRLLRDNRFAVDPPYWPRAAFVTAVSVLNSLQRMRERMTREPEVARTEIREPPLFVLGHWRSGTRLLHELLSLDAERVAFPSTYQVMNPLTFLSSETLNTRLLSGLMPKVRPCDAMEVGFHTPQEDEFATCLMTLRSTYLAMSFPRRADHYLRYLTFDGVPEAELQEWKQAFLRFLRKLTHRHGGRSLVLKSPPHTARLRILLELFPDARFVFVHRHPYRVFQSMRHNADTMFWYSYLQRPDARETDEGIIRTYAALFDAFFRDRGLVPERRLCEVRFDDLEADPVRQVRRIYEELDLPGFTGFEPLLRRRVSDRRGYRKNRLDELDGETKRRLRAEWGRSFLELGYEA
jgi:hypothetical protein